MSKLEKILTIGIVIIAILFANTLLSKEPYQGHIAEPVQINLTKAETITIPDEVGNVELSLLAKYTIEGVVKSKKKYSDYTSRVSKYDFALAWGDLNEQEIDDHIRYYQSGRWYYYQCSGDSLVSQDYISNHSANVHLIHKDKDVLNKIKKIRENEYVRLEGYLVNVNFKDGSWKTSLSRSDTGNGSCEIMYVTNVKTIDWE